MTPQNTSLAGLAVALAIGHALVMPPHAAHAGLIEVTGASTTMSPPESVRKHAFESDSAIHVFIEHTNLTLQRDIRVNAAAPGLYDSRFDLQHTWIDAGTAVNSYFVHQDPRGALEKVTLSGTLTFDTEILGVIVRKRPLWISDPDLGNAATLYPLNPNVGRGLELNPARDWFVISEDMRTVEFHFSTRRAMDQMRIVTAVPGPGALTMLAAAMLAPAHRRRRGHRPR